MFELFEAVRCGRTSTSKIKFRKILSKASYFIVFSPDLIDDVCPFFCSEVNVEHQNWPFYFNFLEVFKFIQHCLHCINKVKKIFRFVIDCVKSARVYWPQIFVLWLVLGLLSAEKLRKELLRLTIDPWLSFLHHLPTFKAFIVD